MLDLATIRARAAARLAGMACRDGLDDPAPAADAVARAVSLASPARSASPAGQSSATGLANPELTAKEGGASSVPSVAHSVGVEPPAAGSAKAAGAPPTASGRWRLEATESDRAHATAWTQEQIRRFLRRVSRLQRLGLHDADAEDLAERLHLRDIDGDDRVSCLECRPHRRGRCTAHERALLRLPQLAPELAGAMQRCGAFDAVGGRPVIAGEEQA